MPLLRRARHPILCRRAIFLRSQCSRRTIDGGAYPQQGEIFLFSHPSSSLQLRATHSRDRAVEQRGTVSTSAA
ncbi:unnamed protein product [Larinioides sclopetarius]|uniref:Uncharacterized protein n=1 Tax=Larinioides sclopetarius TaxID=280406 RepID=A0AAV2AJS0_9ARAC